MDNFFTQNTSDEPDDIPQTENLVWILGEKYNAKKGIFYINPTRNDDYILLIKII